MSRMTQAHDGGSLIGVLRAHEDLGGDHAREGVPRAQPKLVARHEPFLAYDRAQIGNELSISHGSSLRGEWQEIDEPVQ